MLLSEVQLKKLHTHCAYEHGCMQGHSRTGAVCFPGTPVLQRRLSSNSGV